MESRYSYTQTTKSEKGKTVTKSLLLPVIEPKDTDIYIVTNSTDRLDTLSYKYYQTTSYWWIIALVNNLANGTMAVPPGTRIIIPADIAEIITKIKDINK